MMIKRIEHLYKLYNNLFEEMLDILKEYRKISSMDN